MERGGVGDLRIRMTKKITHLYLRKRDEKKWREKTILITFSLKKHDNYIVMLFYITFF